MYNNLGVQNLLLRVARQRAAFDRKLRPVLFEAGHRFWTANRSIPYALFPVRGILALQISPSKAKHVEVALVGREGFAGVSLVLGQEKALTTAVAVTAGEAVAMPPAMFRACLGSPVFEAAVLRYTHSFFNMLANISVCNRIHVIEKLCIGHLLMMQDRTQASSFQVTHDFFSRLLGVRRASVSRAAARLQKQGMIYYDRRGRLTILDRRQLERSACSCYQAIQSDFHSLVESQGGF